MVVILIVIIMPTLVVDDVSSGSDDDNAKEDDYIMKRMVMNIMTIERMEMTAFVFKAYYAAGSVLS